VAFWESSGAFVLYGAALGGASSFLVMHVQAKSTVVLAREQRLFDRRAAAYVEVEEYLWRMLGQAQGTLFVLLKRNRLRTTPGSAGEATAIAKMHAC